MIANYHTHTQRCRHACGTETAYVENAIHRGLKIFGFSDHTPQYFPGDYYSFMRMYPQELEDYCNTVRNLQKQYQGKIEIPLGLEAEYYPATWTEMLARAKDAGIEYLILGQHWLGNEQNEHGSAAATAADCRMDSRILFSAGRAAISKGLFAENVRQVYGLPIAITGKSPFFDRKPKK